MRRLALALCLFGMSGGCGRLFIRDYSELSVTDAISGDPIVGVDVVVFEQSDFGRRPEFAARTAPTDPRGRTLIPIFRTISRSDVFFVMSIAVSVEGHDEILDIANRAGACSQGDHFAVCVLDTDAPAPPPPVLQVIEGSNPPLIGVEGYITAITVCSADLGVETWGIRPYRDGFHVSIAVGTVPFGFEDSLSRALESTNGEPLPCPVSVSGSPPNSFIPVASPPFGNTRVAGEPFCVDADGAAVVCVE